MKRYVSLLSLMFVSLASGCAGGFDCPFDRPTCCDNVLFGCGPFDLPAGCSCNDYFLRSFSGMALQKTSTPQPMMSMLATSTDSTGTWRATGQKTVSTSCPLFPLNATSTLLLREDSRRVSIKALGYTTLRGLRNGNIITTQGALKIPALNCMAFITSTLDVTNPLNAPQTVKIDLKCVKAANSCSTTYKGLAKKLG